ncbi:class I SAM-dependent methyltransferase [Candidatus Bipolaricaulota bacterium]|nr:class I SAM-dependent methyltransferase [Candidatus Bipolaricaulota bacterium]
MNDNPFETRAREYDAWYDEFPNLFRSEILAVRASLPPPGQWVEVGVGTGRFASELGIHLGIEPADAMAVLARGRGIDVTCGRAEAVPLDSECMDAVFFITTLCFVRDLNLALCEARRILRPGGCCIVALLPLDSPLGQITHASEDAFFKHAQLRTKGEVFRALRSAGLTIQQTVQTLLGSPEDFDLEIQTPISGHDRGSFIVVSSSRNSEPLPSPKQRT